jgi:hypothetical protein
VRSIRRLLTVSLITALVSVALPVQPAHATVWRPFPSGVNRTCSPSSVYNGHSHQVCLDFNSSRGEVRGIAFINPRVSTSFKVDMRLWFGGSGPSVTFSCPNITTSASLACYSDFTTLVRPYVVVTATWGISGATMTTQRAQDMRLSGKTQQRDNWCGPAAAQTIIATMGISAPTQAVLADRMLTGSEGTLLAMMDDGINDYVPQDWPYHLINVPGSNMPRYVGLNKIVESLSRGRPVAVMVKPGQLPWYAGGPGTARHFIVVHGYGGHQTTNPDVADVMPWTPTNFKVWDPGFDYGSRAQKAEFTITVDDLFAAAYGADFPVDSIPGVAS